MRSICDYPLFVIISEVTLVNAVVTAPTELTFFVAVYVTADKIDPIPYAELLNVLLG